MATRNEVRDIKINAQQPIQTLKNLRGEARKLKRAIDNATDEQEFVRLNKRLGEVNGEMGKITTRAKQIQGQGSTGISGLTKSFGKLKAGAVAAILAIIDALVKLAIQTDRTARETLKLRDAITTLTSTTGKELDSVSSQIQALGKRFDKDFNEVLQASINFSKQFGISQQQALDLIEKGFIKGADLSGDFLDKIREYPQFFKEAGFSAEEFIAAATTEVREGVFSDKFLDAIKETGLRLKEFSKTQKDAITDAFGSAFADDFENRIKSGSLTIKQALEVIQQQAAQSNLSVQQLQKLTTDLGGGPAEDVNGLGEVFRLLAESQKLSLEATTEAEKANKGLLESQKQVAAANQLVAEEYREIAQASDENRNRLKLLISQGVLKFLRFIKPLIKEIKDFIIQSTFVKAAVANMQVAFKVFSRITSVAFQVLRAGFRVFAVVIKLLGDFTMGIVDAARNVVRFVSNLGIIQPIAKRVSAAFGVLGKEVQSVIKFFQNLDKIVGGVGRSLGGLTSRLGNAIKSLGTLSRSQISKNFGDLFSGAKIADDFNKGFEEVRKANEKAQTKLTKDNKKAQQNRQKDRRKAAARTLGIRSQLTQDEIKAAQDAAKKLAEEQQKRLALRQAVNKRIRDLTIANIQDETTRAIAARTAAAQDEIEALKGTEQDKAIQQKLIEQQLQTDLAAIRQQAAEKKAEEDKLAREKELEEKFAQIEKDKEVAQFALIEIDNAEREIREQTAEQFFEFEKARLNALFEIEQAALNRKLKLAASDPKRQAAINKQIEANQAKHTEDLNKLDTQRINYKKELEKQQMSIIASGLKFLEAAFGENEALTKANLAFEAASAISKIIQNGTIERAKLSALYPFPANIPLIAAQKIRQGFDIASVVASKAPKIIGEKGGLLQGPSHAAGGIPGTGAFGNIEVEGGEVLLSKATRANNPELVNRLLYSSLNEGGRRIMQDGGVLPQAPATGATVAANASSPEAPTDASAAVSGQQAQMLETLERIEDGQAAMLAFMEANADLYRKAFISYTDLTTTAQQAQTAEDDNTLQ